MGYTPVERPDGWTPEALIQWMEENPRGAVSQYMDLVLDGRDRPSKQTLTNDLSKWKKKDGRFARRYNLLMENRGIRQHRGGRGSALETRPGMEDWKERFCLEYCSSRSKIKAAEKVGVSLWTVGQHLKPDSPTYDEDFAETFKRVEAVIEAGCEADLWHAVALAKADEDAKTLGHLTLQILERINKTKWSRQETRHVEHKHSGSVTLELSPKQEKAIQSAALISKRLGFEKKSLPFPEKAQDVGSEDIVDAEVLSESHS